MAAPPKRFVPTPPDEPRQRPRRPVNGFIQVKASEGLRALPSLSKDDVQTAPPTPEKPSKEPTEKAPDVDTAKLAEQLAKRKPSTHGGRSFYKWCFRSGKGNAGKSDATAADGNRV
mmetsp:Transcript_8261/g.15028  ORF Transcript_8261/g.15028 Transcript_8261/m.15028 type:complete len:116 (-) Transcript_8261:120-467(-)